MKTYRILPLLALLMSIFTSAQAVELKEMKVVFELQKELADLTSLSIEGKFCKVNISQSDAPGVTRIHGTLEALAEHEDYKMNFDLADGAATVTVQVPTEAFSSFVGAISIELGADVALTINNTSGYIEMSNISGNVVSLTTGQGRVTVADFRGKLTANTKAGKITCTNIDGEVNTTSLKGDQNFTDVKGKLTFESQDGSVVLTNMEGAVTGKTVAGLQTYQNITGEMNIKGSTGAIKLSNSEVLANIKTLSSAVNLFEVKGELHIETTKGAIVGQKGITLTASSDFTTTEGKINLRLTNDTSELTFDLASESSDAAIIARGTSKKKKLQMGKGAIVITGRTRTGGQVYA